MPHTLHLVSHTHWDREWYLTFQQFRMRLVDLIDRLLDLLDHDPEFRSFHLDSQTIVLEDYLQVRPHNRARLDRCIREGRIVVGPWYQLNDEFLTSGEATVRSLLIGTRIAREFGACAQIGYLPDQFGNISQMPQIFRGFGIDNAVFGRGYQLAGDRKMEFTWQSPDGSRVIASLMALWYNNAQHVPADPGQAQRYLENIRERMAGVSAVSHLLLMNGVDHLEAQADLSASLSGVRPLLPEGVSVRHARLQEYIDALKQEVGVRGITLQTKAGELREDRGGSCLAGTLSSRMYLKQANHHAQVTLEKYAEPLASFAMLLGAPYLQDFLHFAWKLLMQNHPHDSICGCSIDQVHREMMPRFAQVEQIGAELSGRALGHIASRVGLPAGETGLVVFNSLSWPRTDPVQATLVFPLGPATRGSPPRDDSRRVKGMLLFDEKGESVPFAVAGEAVRTRQVLSPVELPLDQWVQEISIEFIARDVPACGYQAYRVTAVEAMPQFEPWQPSGDRGWVPVFVDGGDVGDEYLYRAPVDDRLFELPVLGETAREERSAVRRTAVYTSTWELPAAATGDLAGRQAGPAACTLTTRVTRWAGCPRIEYQTTVDNSASDHRLRVHFRSAGEAFRPLPFSIAEGQFDVIERPLDNPLAGEGAAPFYPQQNWVALTGQTGNSSEGKTVVVANHGLPEYEIFRSMGGAEIAVTLLRCVSYLSRRDDGPEIETPEAQCQGEHTFRFAFFETAGSWQAGRAWQQAHQFNTPLAVAQVKGEPAPSSSDLPLSMSFLTVEPEQLVVTAIKRAEDDPSWLIVRFFNISDEALPGGRVQAPGAVKAWRTNLNEEPQQELVVQAGGVIQTGSIRPKEIVTLAFALG